MSDYEPKIWRRFQVPGNITMSRLGYILMTMYEMKANHLFCLTVPIRENVALEGKMGGGNDGFVYPDEIWRFEIENEELFPEERTTKVYDASEHKMKSILLGCRGEKLILEYDYGDGWEVEVTLESITEDKELSGRELPRVLEGEGCGIVEDCGGAGGLERLAEAFSRQSGEDYEELCECGYAPSKRSIDFLERKYQKQ